MEKKRTHAELRREGATGKQGERRESARRNPLLRVRRERWRGCRGNRFLGAEDFGSAESPPHPTPVAAAECRGEGGGASITGHQAVKIRIPPGGECLDQLNVM